MKEIVRLHGVLISIISERATLFTYTVLRKLQDELGTQFTFTMAFHPQMYGQS